MDWVVQGETYGLDTAPYVLNPFDAADEGVNLILPLTSHDDLNAFSASRFPTLEQTAVRVKGQMMYGISGMNATSVGSWNVKFHARIAVTTQQVFTPTPTQETALQYDMRQPNAANDDFLWEYVDSINFVNGFWDDGAAQPWQFPKRIEVDVRVSRRLRQREVLALFLQTYCSNGIQAGGAGMFVATPDARVWIEPVFRTLVRTIT